MGGLTNPGVDIICAMVIFSAMAEKIQFHHKKDYKKLAPLLALAYSGFITSLFMSQRMTSLSDYALQFGVISAMFLSLRLPYVRQVPLALTRVFAKALMAHKTSQPPQDILDDVEELRQKAGISDKIKTRIIEKGVLNNAYTFGSEIYIGKNLVRRMDRNELKSIIAHEMSHIKTNDISERYLTWPPYIDSIMVAVGASFTVLNTVASGNTKMMPAAFLTAALSYAYFKCQSAIYHGFNRIIEYRADRNSISLTQDFRSAATALAKLAPEIAFKKAGRYKKLYSSHPIGIDRLRHIERCGTKDGTTICMERALKLAREDEDKEAATDIPHYFIKVAYRDTNGGTRPVTDKPQTPAPGTN